MPHAYRISTGEWLDPDGKVLGIGYSGKDDGDGIPEPGEGKNDPTKTAERGIGPLPVGTYRIGLPFEHVSTGKFTMRLTPFPGVETFGRSGFLIHGEGRTRGAASRGCIILPRGARLLIGESKDRVLNVIP